MSAANDDAVPGDGRNETQAERLDRNWDDLLQELRVAQTGTQILTGFLLTIPFQQRFTELDNVQRDIYVVLVAASIAATLSGLAPVALHRGLFRRRLMARVVGVSNILVTATLILIALPLAGAVALVVSVVVDLTAGWVGGSAALAVALLLWLALPAFASSRAAITRRGTRAGSR